MMEKTNEEILDELIRLKKSEGKKEPRIEVKNLFVETFLKMLKEKGVQNGTLKYVIDGYVLGSVEVITKYLNSSPSIKFEIPLIIKSIKQDSKNVQVVFKVLVQMFCAYCTDDKNINREILPQLIVAINSRAFNAKNPNIPNVGNVKVFRKNCFDRLRDSNCEFIKLNTLGLDNNELNKFRVVMKPVVEDYELSSGVKNQQMADRLRRWVGLAKPVIKASVEQNTGTVAKNVSDVPASTSVEINKVSSNTGNVPNNRQGNNNNTPIKDVNQGIINATSVYSFTDMRAWLDSIEKAMQEKEKCIAMLETANKELISKYEKEKRILQGQIESEKLKADTISDYNTELKGKISEAEKEKENLKKSYEDLHLEHQRATELATIKQNEAERNHKAFILKLGKELKVYKEDYQQLSDKDDNEMKSKGLQLTAKRIFVALEKNGVKIGE